MKLGLGRRGLSFGGSGGPPKPVTDFFNGFELSGSTYSGGPTVVPDNTGALVTSPAGVLPIEGMRLATTVADGALLGPGLALYPDTGGRWTAVGTIPPTNPNNNTTYLGLECKSIDFPAVENGGYTVSRVQGENHSISLGKRYRHKATVAFSRPLVSGELVTVYFTGSWGFLVRFNYGEGTGTTEWASRVSGEEVAQLGGIQFPVIFAAILYSPVTVYVRQQDVNEVIPTWLPTTSLGAPIHTSTPLRTRKGTVSVYDESFKGPLVQPPRTNKVTCRKANPVDTTNITKAGDAAAVLSVVDDSAALAAAGLDKICTSGKVYKLDNSAGTGSAYAIMSGPTNNTNPHSCRVYGRATGANGSVGFEGGTDIVKDSGYVPCGQTNIVPGASIRTLGITARAGGITYFILPQLEEGAFATSPIALASDGSDPLTSLTRPAANLTRPTAGTALASLNNWGIRLRFRPTAAGQTAVLWGSYTDANNSTRIDLAASTLTYTKRLAGSNHVAQASLTHAAATLYDVIIYQHSVSGMGIAFRSWNGSAWSAWSAWTALTDANGIANAAIAATYQLGAANNASHVSANMPFCHVFTLKAALAAQTEIADLLSKGRI